MKIPGWVWIAGLAGAGFALYRLSDTLRRTVASATEPVSGAIASTLLAFDSAGQGKVLGSAVFPSGAQVPLKNLTVKPSGSGANFRALVTYQGRTYALSSHDANGNYPAVLV